MAINKVSGNRAQCLQELQQSSKNNEQWDVIIVGGGITGAGILREASRIGLNALLLEQQDFAWGTSSRSSKMIHGGLRYLTMGDLKLTRHSLQERERLLQEAPGLIDRMGYNFTLRRKKSPPAFAVKIMLWLYDTIAGIKNHHSLSVAQLQQKFSQMDVSKLKKAFFYTDAVTDDARLVQRVLQEAEQDGGIAVNYMRVAQLLKNGDEVTGVRVEDCSVDGQSFSIDLSTKFVVNSTGAWADYLRNQVNPEKRVRPLRGSHLVLAKGVLPIEEAIALMHPVDNRSVFLFPWFGNTVIGTTDLDHPQSLNTEASITPEEVEYLLAVAQDLYAGENISVDKVISSWAGVRPIIASEKSKDPSKERRDHAVWQDGRLITISGGKLTTFRLLAHDVLTAAQDFIDPQKLAHLADDNAKIFSPTRLKQLHGCSQKTSAVLLARYGDIAQQLVASAQEGELELISPTPFTLAECRWALQQEDVVHLDDLMIRRTRLGLLLPNAGAEIIPAIKTMCQQVFAWDDDTWQQEFDRYMGIWTKYYSLPAEVS